MTPHPTTALLLADERRRDLEPTAMPPREPEPRPARRPRRALRKTAPASLTRTT
jgi:hypothetical protein